MNHHLMTALLVISIVVLLAGILLTWWGTRELERFEGCEPDSDYDYGADPNEYDRALTVHVGGIVMIVFAVIGIIAWLCAS